MKLTLILEDENGNRGMRGSRAAVRAKVAEVCAKDAVACSYALARLDALPETAQYIYVDATANFVTNEKTGGGHFNVQVVIDVL